MKLINVTVGGFTNIEKVSLSITQMCALLSYNNYGKSNVLNAILFGLNFLRADNAEKNDKMRRSINYIPINNATAGNDYEFEIEMEVQDKSVVTYGYRFAWPKKNRTPHITAEYLRIKGPNESKSKSYIKRETDSCAYLSSISGRCSSKLDVLQNQLAINKLSNFDNLFYVEKIKEILDIKIVETNTLADPTTFFRTITVMDDKVPYSGDIHEVPDFGSCAYFIYNLKKSSVHKYKLLQDAIMQLIPNIEDFEPVKVNLKEQTKFKDDKNLPFYFPEYLYDIRGKERSRNQQITIDKLSAGTKKVFYILLMAVAADLNGAPLMIVEELENSIHPSLFQKLLTTIKALAGNTKIIFTSHSPYLLQYIKPEMLYIGIPNNNGIAAFKKLKSTKINALMREASSVDMSLGDYIFDMLLDIDDISNELATKYFE